MPLTDPDQSIGFLLADVSRLLRRDFDRRVRSLELTQAQWRAIAHLAGGQGIRQAVLAERLEVAPITLARLIDRMAAAGWVTRSPDPDDRRASLLHLTPKAEPVLEEMRTRASEALEDLMDGVSESARKELIAALARMKENLLAAEPGGEPRTTERTQDDGDGREHPKRRIR